MLMMLPRWTRQRGIDQGGIMIPPGGSYFVELGFNPRGEGSYQDFFQIRCNATNAPLVSIPLYGQTLGDQPASSGYIRTDRGCKETGENPLYFVNDPIELRLRVDSQSGETQANARIDDITPRWTGSHGIQSCNPIESGSHAFRCAHRPACRRRSSSSTSAGWI